MKWPVTSYISVAPQPVMCSYVESSITYITQSVMCLIMYNIYHSASVSNVLNVKLLFLTNLPLGVSGFSFNQTFDGIISHHYDCSLIQVYYKGWFHRKV